MGYRRRTIHVFDLDMDMSVSSCPLSGEKKKRSWVMLVVRYLINQPFVAHIKKKLQTVKSQDGTFIHAAFMVDTLGRQANTVERLLERYKYLCILKFPWMLSS